MASEAPGRVGRLAIPVIMDFIKARRMKQVDEATTNGLLQLLTTLLAPSASGTEVLALLLREPENLDALLELLEESDVYTVVLMLEAFEKAADLGGPQVEAAMQQRPQSITRLIAYLSDPREEVRNMVLLLLTKLTARNEEIKKLVAFEDGFEKVFSIIAEEGGVQWGGVIVQDCLRLLCNLVDSSVLTQRSFCELGHLKSLAAMLDLRELEDSEDGDSMGGVPVLRPNQRDGLHMVLCALRLLVRTSAHQCLYGDRLMYVWARGAGGAAPWPAGQGAGGSAARGGPGLE
jgi:hypothetical protein